MISDWERCAPMPEGSDGEPPPEDTEEPRDEDEWLEQVDREIDREKENEDEASANGSQAEPDPAHGAREAPVV